MKDSDDEGFIGVVTDSIKEDRSDNQTESSYDWIYEAPQKSRTLRATLDRSYETLKAVVTVPLDRSVAVDDKRPTAVNGFSLCCVCGDYIIKKIERCGKVKTIPCSQCGRLQHTNFVSRLRSIPICGVSGGNIITPTTMMNQHWIHCARVQSPERQMQIRQQRRRLRLPAAAVAAATASAASSAAAAAVAVAAGLG